MRYLKIGDIIVDSNGVEKKILAERFNRVLLSHYANIDEPGIWYTERELNEDGYHYKEDLIDINEYQCDPTEWDIEKELSYGESQLG